MAELHEFNIKIAELNVKMLCRYPYAKRLCTDFLVGGSDSEADKSGTEAVGCRGARECDGAIADIVARVSAEQIASEKALSPEMNFSDGYCEGICLYRDIAEQLPRKDGFVFHGAAVNVGGRGCVFTARSGTGKTTHISLLMREYPDDVRIINGDKPIIRKVGDEWRVYSTPWAGKEGMKENTSAPLSAVVLLERGEQNSIEKIDPSLYFEAIMGQIYIPKNKEALLKTYDLLDEMSGRVEFYRLRCNMERDAAATSYSALK